MRNIERHRAYQREYFRLIRAIRFPAHDYIKQTHCRDCRRVYNRDHMRRARGSWLATLLLPLPLVFISCSSYDIRTPEEAAAEERARARANCQWEAGELWGKRVGECLRKAGWRR